MEKVMYAKRLNWLILVLLLAGLVTFTVETPSASAAPAFNDPGFANTWNRVDKPVEERSAGLGRGYTWGPIIAGTESIKTEPYGNGTRTVQYFDKARMEVNNPQGNPNDRYYVTTGLLVKELVTGLRQDGDSKFTPALPSREYVAGDPTNNVAPTYADFRRLVSFTPGENSFADLTGRSVGALTTQDTAPEERKNVFYDTVTKHNIPDVFMDYARTQGLIWDGSSFANGAVYYDDDMVYVRGRPVSEAYWIRATVGGTVKPVMVQLFERRVLTYTPSNPAGFKVEMGNVGQHYYRWRYQNDSKVTLQWELGVNPYRLREQSALAVDSDGNTYIAGQAVTGNLAVNKYGPDNSLAAQFPLVACLAGRVTRILYAPSPNRFYVLQNAQNTLGKATASCVQEYDSNFTLRANWPNEGLITGLALDKATNLYVADDANHVIRKYSPDRRLVAQWGSAGSADGQFQQLRDLTVDSAGNIYTLDVEIPATSTVPERARIQKFNSSGKFLLKWGKGIDLQKPSSLFNPSQLRIDSSDRVYVNEYSPYIGANNGVIHQFTGDGAEIVKTPNSTLFAVDFVEYSKDTIYALGTIYSDPYVRRLDAKLKLVGEWRFNDTEKGQFAYPGSVAVNSKGEIFVADKDVRRIQKFDTEGKFLSQIPGVELLGLATDRQDNLFTVEGEYGKVATVRKLDANGKQVISWEIAPFEPGVDFTIRSMVTDNNGNVYFADEAAGRILKYDNNGKFLQQWRTINRPSALAVDNQNNLIVYEGENRFVRYTSDGTPGLRWKRAETSEEPFLEYPKMVVDARNNLLVTVDSFNLGIERYSEGVLNGSWQYTIGSSGGLALASDGALVATVHYYYNAHLIKFRLN
jgi:hypothetical protein